MAEIKAIMTALGNEPQICYRPFERGEVMSAVVYTNGDEAGWHTKECIQHWLKTGEPKCMEQSKEMSK